MDLLVCLHGMKTGYIKIYTDSDKLTYTERGIPKHSRIYVICNDRPYNIDYTDCKNISAVIVTDSDGNIIMEGNIRGHTAINEKSRANVLRKKEYQYKTPLKKDIVADYASTDYEQIKNVHRNEEELSEIQSSEEHSPALNEILKKAEDLFSNSALPGESENIISAVNQNVQKQKFNPFFSTYPDSTWRKITDKRGRLIRLEGKATVENQKLNIVALPINMYNEAYFIKNGFQKHLKTDNGYMFRLKVKRD